MFKDIILFISVTVVVAACLVVVLIWPVWLIVSVLGLEPALGVAGMVVWYILIMVAILMWLNSSWDDLDERH